MRPLYGPNSPLSIFVEYSDSFNTHGNPIN